MVVCAGLLPCARWGCWGGAALDAAIAISLCSANTSFGDDNIKFGMGLLFLRQETCVRTGTTGRAHARGGLLGKRGEGGQILCR